MRIPSPWLAFRPTGRGWQALAVGAMVMGVARLIGTTQFYQLAYALFALLLAALVIGALSYRGLDFTRGLPPGPRITAGARVRIDLQITNGSRLDTSDVEVVDNLPEPRSFRLPPIRGGGEEVVEVPIAFSRRGVYELGPAEVRVLDPFRLLRFSQTFDECTEVVVYPEVHDLAELSRGLGSGEDGSRGSIGQRGDEFASLREYRRGDDRRHIHWKSVARTGELYVREFSPNAPQRHTVVLDLRREGLRTPENEVEDAVSAAASVLTHLARESLPFRLMCMDGEVSGTEEFGTSEATYWQAMRLLATVRVRGSGELGPALLEERHELGEGVVLVWRTRDESVVPAVLKLLDAGLSVAVVAVATHAYRYPGSGGEVRETDFLRDVGRLEAGGASVQVVRPPAGVAGISGGRKKIGS